MSKDALTILGERENATAVAFSKLQSVAIHQLALIKQMERDSCLRAILVGLTLHRIKAVLKHGEFGSWIDANVDGAGRVQCRFYMRLAIAFVDRTKATRPEILALPGDQSTLSLDTQDAAARRLMEKAAAFIGDRSLNELLADLGIKDRAAAKRKALAAGKAKANAATEAETVQELFNRVAEGLRDVREAAVDRTNWMSFTKRQHEDLRAMFESAADRVTEVFVKTHGKHS